MLKKQHVFISFIYLLIFATNYTALYLIRKRIVSEEIVVTYFNFHSFYHSCMDSVAILVTYRIFFNRCIYLPPSLTMGHFFLVCYGVLGCAKIVLGIVMVFSPVNQQSTLAILSFMPMLLFLSGFIYFFDDFCKRTVFLLCGLRFAIQGSLYFIHIGYLEHTIIIQVARGVFLLFLLYTLKTQKSPKDILSTIGVTIAVIYVFSAFLMNFLHLIAYICGYPQAFI